MRILNTKQFEHSGLKIIVYGEAGVGKTTLAKTTGEPTLIISAESGLLSLAGSDIDVIDLSTDNEGKVLAKEKRIARLGDVYKYVNDPATQKKYKWIFLDSMTEIFQNLVEQLQVELPDAKDAIKLWGEYTKRARSLIKSFRDLPHYNVVFTALAQEEKDDNNRRFIRIDVNGKIAHQLPAFFDEVFYYYIQRDNEGNEKRVLLTGKQDNVAAKDRSGTLEKFEAPNLANIAKQIRTKTQPTEPSVKKENKK